MKYRLLRNLKQKFSSVENNKILISHMSEIKISWVRNPFRKNWSGRNHSGKNKERFSIYKCMYVT